MYHNEDIFVHGLLRFSLVISVWVNVWCARVIRFVFYFFFIQHLCLVQTFICSTHAANVASFRFHFKKWCGRRWCRRCNWSASRLRTINFYKIKTFLFDRRTISGKNSALLTHTHTQAASMYVRVVVEIHFISYHERGNKQSLNLWHQIAA